MVTVDVETFNRHVFKSRVSTNFLDMKLACDPQFNKARHALRELSSTIAVESKTCSLLKDLEA